MVTSCLLPGENKAQNSSSSLPKALVLALLNAQQCTHGPLHAQLLQHTAVPKAAHLAEVLSYDRFFPMPFGQV